MNLVAPCYGRTSCTLDYDETRREKQEIARVLKAARQAELKVNAESAQVGKNWLLSNAAHRTHGQPRFFVLVGVFILDVLTHTVLTYPGLLPPLPPEVLAGFRT